MRFVMFYHSLVSDWNHGNAHFLRGIVGELRARGHQVEVHEPEDAWSVQNLLADHGPEALAAFARAYPGLESQPYQLDTLDLEAAVHGADVVLVHEWNDPLLIGRLSRLAAAQRPEERRRFLFHDTHHRALSAPGSIEVLDLRGYHAVLAFGRTLHDLYLERRWCRRAFVWHEAADTRMFYPRQAEPEADLVWIGNWGDDERSRELFEFLIEPVRALGLQARVYGVRYPPQAREALAAAGIEYRGWLPNFAVPDVFARHRVTVHVPRGYYASGLPGIPTIRPFEALACGIPLVSAPWTDSEGLFTAGRDYLLVHDGRQMQAELRRLLSAPDQRRALAAAGLARIREAHSCRHRVDELFGFLEALGARTPRPVIAAHQAVAIP
jgi:spore maturation protein CgeB